MGKPSIARFKYDIRIVLRDVNRVSMALRKMKVYRPTDINLAIYYLIRATYNLHSVYPNIRVG